MITITILLFAAILLSGCSTTWFSCQTVATYNKDGEWSYKSCKNQENFKAYVGTDKNGRQFIEVETTATTAESAIIAASKGMAVAFDSLNRLIPILEKAALTGGS